MINKIISIKETVKAILINFPDTRDNDRLLMLKVWSTENNLLRDKNYPFYDFALGFIKKDYSDPESIRRSRQKIQEIYHELRGKTWSIRQNEKEDEMRREIPKMDI